MTTNAEIETIRILTEISNTAQASHQNDLIMDGAILTVSIGILLVNVIFYAKKWKVGGKS